MTPILQLTHAVSATAATFLVASMWQGLIVTACVAILLRLLPGLSAAVRSAIWTAVLLMVVLVPALSISLHHSSASTIPYTHLLHVSDRWSLALLVAWAIFSLFRISQLVVSAFRLQHLARHAVAVTPSEHIASLLRRSNRHVELCSSAKVDKPSVAGFFRPRILISPELLTTLSASELEQVVLHEMEHLRRYDDWTNLLQKLSLALIPLHPVLLWLDRQLCLQRELACDDSVLRHTRSRKAYASCLARLAEYSLVRRGFSLALGTLGNRERTSELANRVHRILRAPEKGMPRGKAFLTTATLLTIAFIGTARLARSPQLIAFTSTAKPTASSQAIFTPRYEPASFKTTTAYDPSMAHPQLLKAVVSERSLPSVIPTAAHKTRRHIQFARNAVQRDARISEHYVTLTAWQPTTTSTRLVPAVAQDSQIFYAAVPTPDGWLLIQL